MTAAPIRRIHFAAALGLRTGLLVYLIYSHGEAFATLAGYALLGRYLGFRPSFRKSA